VADGKRRQLAKAELRAQDVLEAIRHQVNRDVRRLFDEYGNHKPISELSAEEAAMIAGYEIVIKNAKAGDGITDTMLKVRLPGSGEVRRDGREALRAADRARPAHERRGADPDTPRGPRARRRRQREADAKRTAEGRGQTVSG
jgi:hypothetical protein